MAIACTQAERDELAAAIKAGITRVTYSSGGSSKTVEYASIAEMRAVLAEMDEYLAGSSAADRFSRASYSRR